MSQQNTRARILQTAEGLVNGDRNVQYGDPRADFQRTADMWSAYLGVEVAPHDVAALMCLLKVSRIRWSPEKEDSWVDLAGYAACGADCALPSVPVDEAQPAPNPPIVYLTAEQNAKYEGYEHFVEVPGQTYLTSAEVRIRPATVRIYDQDSGTTREVYPDGD